MNNDEVDLHSVLHSVLCSGNEAEVDSFDSSYAHMSSACEWKISIERDSGIGAETQSRRSMAMFGEDWRGLTMTILQIPNDRNKMSIGDETKSESLTENLMQKTERCRGDSVDSAICAWGTHMFMTFSNAHEVLPRSSFMGFFYADARGL